ncbi:MAG: hypothetical protein NTW98_00430 [Candidatus Nomurabacteria bacterium]|nr:hypothetical protein [Candidatus Nomurabacteria bacterium]
MDEDLKKKIDEQGVKIDAMYKSLEKIRMYFKIMAWITILAVVVPLLGLVFAVPMFMSSYVDQLSGLGL